MSWDCNTVGLNNVYQDVLTVNKVLHTLLLTPKILGITGIGSPGAQMREGPSGSRHCPWDRSKQNVRETKPTARSSQM